jgi:CPA2 family monovalent cation:H+ antiporter-2
MPDHSLLPELVLTYAVALVCILILARVRIPPIVAFIVAGTVAGPGGIGIVKTESDVNLLADLGIVLLLFTVGLEFSLTEIQRIWKAVVFGGSLQIGGTAAVIGAGLLLAAQDWRVSVFIGLFVALSSTAIVLRELGSRNQLDAPHGRLMVGVLLFQDLAIVALLLLVPILSGKTTLSAVPLVLLRAAAAIGAVAIVSRLALPVLFGLVARSGRREAFPLAVLLASIGTAWVSSLLGISMALGAFLGGLILAESEFSHQAHAEIRPLRDILAGLFFISLGMLADFDTIVAQLPMVIGVTLALVGVKAVVAGGSFWAVATPPRIAVTAGIGLAQIGEFSFVLGRAGLDVGLLTSGEWQVLLAASIATMVVTPALVAVAPRVGSWVAEKTKRPVSQVADSEHAHLSGHVVIFGFGVGGRLLGRALRQLAVPYVILDLNGATVREARRAGESIFFGDATNEDALRGAGVDRARAVVIVLSDPYASSRAVSAVRALNESVAIVVRTRYRGEADSFLRLGATVAVAEELEASLEVLAQVFARLDVPGNVIEVLLDGFRRESSGIRPVRAPTQPLEALPSAISQTPIATHQLGEGEWAVGRTLAEVNLRAETGALVIAVHKNGRHLTSPPADLQLSQGDVLYLLGDESDVLLARRRLTGVGGISGAR